jgi:hypothetical protein
LSFYSLYLLSFLVVGVEAGAAPEEEAGAGAEERQTLEHLQALTQ